jgi:hypothetical protein
MNNLSKIITTYAICEFIEYATKDFTNLQEKIQKFSEECELLGGNRELFVELAVREMSACRLLTEQEGAAVAPVANSVGGGGIAGMKPEDLGVPVSAQKRHISRNSIFKRKKPNTYYNDKNNSY